MEIERYREYQRKYREEHKEELARKSREKYKLRHPNAYRVSKRKYDYAELLRKYNEVGNISSLASEYGISRQRMSVLIKEAKKELQG